MLGIATIARVITSIGNFAVPPLMPFLLRDLHLDHVQIGMLVSAFFVGAIVATALAGWLVDAYGVTLSLTLGQLIMGSFLVLASQTSSFSFTAAVLFLAGLGQGFVTPATTKAVMEWASENSRATAMGILMAGVPVGAAVSAAVLPALASSWNWQFSLALVGVTILISTAITSIGYRDFEGSLRSAPGLQHYTRHIRLVLGRSEILFLTTTSILLIIVQTAFVSYLVLFLTEGLTKTVTLAGLYLTVAHLGGACGRIGWGYVSDRWMGGDRRIVLGAIALVSAGAIFALDLLPAQAPPWVLVLVVLLFGVSGLGWAGLHLTSNAEKVDGRLVGTATSVSISLVLLGVITGPLIFGYLVDLTQSYSAAWQAMALIATVASVPLLFITPRGRPARLLMDKNKD